MWMEGIADEYETCFRLQIVHFNLAKKMIELEETLVLQGLPVENNPLCGIQII